MVYAALTCRALIGLVFVVSAFTKLRGIGAYREFSSWLGRLPVALAGRRVLPPVLAAAEAAIVVMVAVPATAVAGLVLAAGTLAALTTGTALAVRRGTRASCRCFGTSRSPLAVRHVVRNGCLLAVAGTGVFVAAGSGAGAVAAHPAQFALSLMAAVAGATFVVFGDDLAALAGGGPAAAAGDEGWAGMS